VAGPLADRKKKKVGLQIKNWTSTGVSDSITQDTTNNNAEHLSGG